MPAEELTISDLPIVGATEDELWSFAGDFDGYGVAGGFDECARIAQAPNMDSISEIRIAMFFSVRAMRHCGDDFDGSEQPQFREYVARIRSILLEREGVNPVGFAPPAKKKEVEMPSTPSTKSFSFGGCNFGKLSPKQEALGPNTKVLNVTLSFEDGLKLDLAIDECVRKLNSYKRSTVAGKRSALNIAVHLDKGRITINEGKI
ncbi:MAG: hypothetical protein KAH56_01060 [Candidatus Krumholzibacteria bacterium]|nr:hypothetical protein [Candidatus Krumholzibacteria bacterium]